MSRENSSFDITFYGNRYFIDVIKQYGDTKIYIECADIDEDIDKSVLQKLTKYLIEEGFVKYE